MGGVAGAEASLDGLEVCVVRISGGALEMVGSWKMVLDWEWC